MAGKSSKEKMKELRAKLKNRIKKKKQEKETRTKGTWFNIVFCFLAFFFVLALQTDFVFMYMDKIFDNTIFSYLVLGFAIIYSLIFLFILGAGFVFNAISKSKGYYPKNSFLLKLDEWINDFLWWLITIFGIGLFLINVLVVECVMETCI